MKTKKALSDKLVNEVIESIRYNQKQYNRSPEFYKYHRIDIRRYTYYWTRILTSQDLNSDMNSEDNLR